MMQTMKKEKNAKNLKTMTLRRKEQEEGDTEGEECEAEE